MWGEVRGSVGVGAGKCWERCGEVCWGMGKVKSDVGRGVGKCVGVWGSCVKVWGLWRSVARGVLGFSIHIPTSFFTSPNTSPLGWSEKIFFLKSKKV